MLITHESVLLEVADAADLASDWRDFEAQFARLMVMYQNEVCPDCGQPISVLLDSIKERIVEAKALMMTPDMFAGFLRNELLQFKLKELKRVVTELLFEMRGICLN